MSIPMTKNMVLLTVNLNKWGIHRKANINLVDTQNADRSLLALSKKLLVSPEWEAINRFDHSIRNRLKTLCPPGSPFKSSFFMIPLKSALEAETICEEAEADRAALVAKFVAAYPAQVAKAATALAQLHNEGDYPKASDIGSYFSMQRNFVTLDVPENLPPEIREKEIQRAEKLWAEVSEELTDAMRASFLSLVDHLEECLKPGETGKEKTFRKDGFNAIKKFMEAFEVKNLTNDLELAKLVQRAKTIVDTSDTEAIKESADVKAAVASKFTELKAVLSGMVTEKAKRQFAFDEE